MTGDGYTTHRKALVDPWRPLRHPRCACAPVRYAYAYLTSLIAWRRLGIASVQHCRLARHLDRSPDPDACHRFSLPLTELEHSGDGEARAPRSRVSGSPPVTPVCATPGPYVLTLCHPIHSSQTMTNDVPLAYAVLASRALAPPSVSITDVCANAPAEVAPSLTKHARFKHRSPEPCRPTG